MVLKYAISLIGQGRKREAQAILMKLIRSDPHEVKAWFWYVETLDSLEDRIRSLQACLNANPEDRDVSQALDLLRSQKPVSLAVPEAPQALSPRPKASREFGAPTFAADGRTVYVESPFNYEPGKESDTDQESSASFPNIDIPANRKVLTFLRANSISSRIAPYEDILGYNSSPSLVDAVGYFNIQAANLPENAKYLLYYCPALVHPETGIIFAFVKGRERYYRLPEKTIDELSSRELVADDDLDHPQLGSDWVSGLMVKDRFIDKLFVYYGDLSKRNAPFPLKLKEDLHLAKFDLKRRVFGLVNRMALFGFFAFIICLEVLLPI
jgi:hypothetical protein